MEVEVQKRGLPSEAQPGMFFEDSDGDLNMVVEEARESKGFRVICFPEGVNATPFIRVDNFQQLKERGGSLPSHRAPQEVDPGVLTPGFGLMFDK